MATTLQSDGPIAESSTKAAEHFSPLKAEHEAAVTAYKQQLNLMGPTRKKYDELFVRHKQIQAHYDNLMARMKSQRSEYQQHKRYFVGVSNALLASNTALRGAPVPFSDFQVLTQATLLNEMRTASEILAEMIFQNRLLDDEKERSFTLDQEFYKRCREMFNVVDKDCRELDQLHAKVLEVERKMGKKAECGSVERNCISCIRNEEKEARRVAAERAIKGSGRKVKGGMGKAAEAKQRLEDILEEEESKDGA